MGATMNTGERDEGTTMLSAIYQGRHDVEVREVPIPTCGPDDVLIRNVRSSVCGTDAAVWTHGPNTGHKVTVGGEFGHETTSVVAEVGENVRDFTVGERVYPYPLLARGDPRRAGTLGAFSQYVLCPSPRRNVSLWAVPDSIPDEVARLIEPFTVGCRAARRGRPSQGTRAVVFGAGTIGIAAAIALTWFGAEPPLVCDLSDLRLQKAAALGFPTCNPAREDAMARAREEFGAARGLDGQTADLDVWVDAAGADSVLDDFLAHGKIGSRMVAVAVGRQSRSVGLLRMTYAQQELVGSGGYLPEDVRDVMAIMGSRRWDIASIVTHVFPLERIAEAIWCASDPAASLNVSITL